MFSHTLQQSSVVRSVSTPRSPGSTAPGPPAACSSSLPESSALMLLGPRRVRPQVIDSSLDKQRGRSYLRRARPVESELALRHALRSKLDVGPEHPYLPFQYSRMPRLNTPPEWEVWCLLDLDCNLVVDGGNVSLWSSDPVWRSFILGSAHERFLNMALHVSRLVAAVVERLLLLPTRSCGSSPGGCA